MTSAVHYVRFGFTGAEVDLFGAGRCRLVSVHPEYPARTELGEASRDELLADLRGTTAPIPLG